MPTTTAALHCRPNTALHALPLLLLLGVALAATTTPSPINVPLSQPQLLLDDFLLSAASGARFVQHSPQKLGAQPVVSPTHPWEQGLYFYVSAVLSPVDNTVHVYYTCSGPLNTTATFLCLATSADGVTFTKPELSLYPYLNYTRTNIVWATPYNGWPNSVTLAASGSAPRFLLTYDYGNQGRLLRVAGSDDGIHFTDLPEQPAPAVRGFADTNTNLLLQPAQGLVAAFGRIDAGHKDHPQACPGNYNTFRNVALSTARLANSTSNNNTTTTAANNTNNHHSPRSPPAVPWQGNFSRPEIVLTWDDAIDPPCVDLYNAAAAAAGAYVLIFPAAALHYTNSSSSIYTREMLKNDGILDVRLAVARSSSLAHSSPPPQFHYISREPFIRRGMGQRNSSTGLFTVGAEWDAGLVFAASNVLSFPDPARAATHHLMYYFGSQMTHGYAAYNWNANTTTAQKGIGALSLRRDGFASLRANASSPAKPQAVAITHPLQLDGAAACTGATPELALFLNADTSISGELCVEVSTAAGRVLPDYARDRSLCIKGNSVAFRAEWAGTADLAPAVAQGPLVFTFLFSSADLYSFTFACAEKTS